MNARRARDTETGMKTRFELFAGALVTVLAVVGMILANS
jgi:hypothetical protein